MKRVYLCGPIAGLTGAEARGGWRAELAALLGPDIKPVSPMRAEPEHVTDVISSMPDAYARDPLLTKEAITGRDRFDVMRCDLVVADLRGQIVSKGSMIELGWADAYRKPVVAIMTPKDCHWHAMVNTIVSVIVPDVEQAARTVNLWLSEGL
jgi:nucleoside 2-deoxyribosyltransferase